MEFKYITNVIKYKLIGANQKLANGALGGSIVYSGHDVCLYITHRIGEPHENPVYDTFTFVSLNDLAQEFEQGRFILVMTSKHHGKVIKRPFGEMSVSKMALERIRRRVYITSP